jgi:hypothetical protein
VLLGIYEAWWGNEIWWGRYQFVLVVKNRHDKRFAASPRIIFPGLADSFKEPEGFVNAYVERSEICRGAFSLRIGCTKAGGPALHFILVPQKWVPRSCVLCKGGNHELMRKGGFVSSDKGCVGIVATRPCKQRKDGAPAALVMPTGSKAGPPAFQKKAG